MLLPASLESTTLGDVLGCLHRGGACGSLQLWENDSAHEIELLDGCVERVQVAAARCHLGDLLRQTSSRGAAIDGALQRACLRVADPRPLGERLVAVGVISRAQMATALRRLHYERLEQLFRLRGARLRFRPLRRLPLPSCGLGPAVFLHGRHRYRDVAARTTPSALHPDECDLRRAYRELGLPFGAAPREIRRAYRQAVSRWHPDRFAAEGPGQVKQAQERFFAIGDSYRRLQRHHGL